MEFRKLFTQLVKKIYLKIKPSKSPSDAQYHETASSEIINIDQEHQLIITTKMNPNNVKKFKKYYPQSTPAEKMISHKVFESIYRQLQEELHTFKKKYERFD